MGGRAHGAGVDTGRVDEQSGPATEQRQQHWDRRYATSADDEVSWFQVRPDVSLALLAAAVPDRTAAVIDIGGGSGRLVDHLVADGRQDVTVLDISEVALARARARVGADAHVHWVVHDLLTWEPDRQYAVWHDRAVFHFLVEEPDRLRYRELLGRALAPGAVVLVGTFADDGPAQCSGLPVARYSPDELVAALGPGFEVLETRREEHLTPSGAVQPFTWVALRRA